MPRKLRVVITDDLDYYEHGTDTDAHETHVIALDGEVRELDLTTEHAAELRGSMRRYLDAGHELGDQPPVPDREPALPAVSGWVVHKALRDWADRHMPDGYARRGGGRTGYDYTAELRLAYLGYLTDTGSPWQHHPVFADLKARLP
jgi:Lsr2 protein